MQVFNQNFKLLGEAQSTSDLGDIVTVQLPSVQPFQRYYIEVDSPATDVFGTGRYALSVTYDGLSLVNPASLPPILRGPYDSLSAGDLAGLLSDVGNVLFQNNLLDLNDTFLTAEPLSSQPGYPANTQYNVVASLDGIFDVDIYRIQAPQAPAGQTDVLTVSLAQMPINGVLPVVSVYDANANPVSSQILLNGNGSYVVQATGLTPGETYYLQVSAAPAPAPAVGNYSLAASFGLRARRRADVRRRHAVGIRTRGSVHPVRRRKPTVPVRLVHQRGRDRPTNTQVSMQIYDSTGAVVFSLIGRLGETVSGASILLTPGAYQVTHLRRQLQRDDGALDRLSGERGQSLGPHRTRPRRTRSRNPCIRARATPRSIATATPMGPIPPPPTNSRRRQRMTVSEV